MNKKEKIDRITKAIIGCAIDIHRALGPGLLESAYEACLVFDLAAKGFKVEQQKPLPVIYKGVKLDCGYRMDLVVDGEVVIELKSVDGLMPIHKAQLLSYLKLSKCMAGLLINFNVKILKDGIQRIVNKLPESPRSPRAQR